MSQVEISDKMPKAIATPTNPSGAEKKGNTLSDIRSLRAAQRHQELVKIERENILIA